MGLTKQLWKGFGKRRSKTRPKWATAATWQAMKDKLKLWKQYKTGRELDVEARLK